MQRTKFMHPSNYLDFKTASTIVTSTVHSKQDFCSSAYCNIPTSQASNRSRTFLHVAKLIHEIFSITLILMIRHKILTNSKSYLLNLISVQSIHVEPAPHLLLTLLDHSHLPVLLVRNYCVILTCRKCFKVSKLLLSLYIKYSSL